MNNYDFFNREEIYLCSHLFRLLHENINSKDGALGRLLSILSSVKSKLYDEIVNFSGKSFENIGIFCEAALIRDKYKDLLEMDKYDKLKPNVEDFMDNLVCLLMEHYKIIDDCRKYSELNEKRLKTIYPGRIRQKAEDMGVHLSENEKMIYKEIQKLFYSSPDLLITIDNYLIVIEAKFTQSFSKDQLNRTKLIAEIWAKLLYKDLGFCSSPNYIVYKLGKMCKHADKNKGADISWDNIYEIAQEFYPEDDRSLIAFERCLEHLKHNTGNIIQENVG